LSRNFIPPKQPSANKISVGRVAASSPAFVQKSEVCLEKIFDFYEMSCPNALIGHPEKRQTCLPMLIYPERYYRENISGPILFSL
jgi:hypothetical protein